MSRRLIVEEKMNRLSEGHTAFAESDEVIRLMKEEISKKNIPVICDQTESGCWFIPDEQTNISG
ncbi:hypothetical protein [Aquibacillus halophilus]|nr:hypothetical protein [Aquibacillus halophilus]